MLRYVEEAKPKDMDNYSVRLLSGVDQKPEFGCVTLSHLSRAKDNLCAFSAFGLTEELEKAASLFVRRFHLSEHRIGVANPTPRAQAAMLPDPPEVEALMRMNELDQELFAFAKARFALLSDQM